MHYKIGFKYGDLDQLYGQNVHSNKMFEMYGENAPQFVLQAKLYIPSTINICKKVLTKA